jgi:hypothetical protein
MDIIVVIDSPSFRKTGTIGKVGDPVCLIASVVWHAFAAAAGLASFASPVPTLCN